MLVFPEQFSSTSAWRSSFFVTLTTITIRKPLKINSTFELAGIRKTRSCIFCLFASADYFLYVVQQYQIKYRLRCSEIHRCRTTRDFPLLVSFYFSSMPYSIVYSATLAVVSCIPLFIPRLRPRNAVSDQYYLSIVKTFAKRVLFMHDVHFFSDINAEADTYFIMLSKDLSRSSKLSISWATEKLFKTKVCEWSNPIDWPSYIIL